MKKATLKKTICTCAALMLVLCMLLTGCAGRRSVSAEEFTTVCESVGFVVEDSSANYNPAQVSNVLTCTTATTTIGYYNFTDAASAKAQYAQLFSSLSTGADGEKYIDSAEYNRFYVSGEGGIALLYRNGTNLIFLAGDESEELKTVIEDLGI